MAEITQTIMVGDPQGRIGNCLQAAVASLLDLDLDDVPHFAEHDDWLNRMVDWANARGWKVQQRPPAAIVPIGIAYGPSVRGVTHAVVFSFGDQVWDPHPSRAGLLSISGIYEFSRIGAA
ncbi:hypothetical protein [Streptacidiphilus sp. PAMC 29251]